MLIARRKSCLDGAVCNVCERSSLVQAMALRCWTDVTLVITDVRMLLCLSTMLDMYISFTEIGIDVNIPDIQFLSVLTFVVDSEIIWLFLKSEQSVIWKRKRRQFKLRVCSFKKIIRQEIALFDYFSVIEVISNLRAIVVNIHTQIDRWAYAHTHDRTYNHSQTHAFTYILALFSTYMRKLRG